MAYSSGTVFYSSLTKEVYNPKAFFLHAALLGQACAHCPIFPMAAARILCKYQDGDKSKKFVVKAGFMEGKVMDAAETNAIAKLPNREGMLSMFAGALTSTLSGLAVAMQAYADKQEEPAA